MQRPAQPRAEAVQPAPSAPARKAKPARVARPPKQRGGGVKIVLQFLLGLLVIVVVAAAIVWLYLRYYQ